MSMTAEETFTAWLSIRNVGVVGAVLRGAQAVLSWRRTRLAIRQARDSGDQMEVVARLRVVIRQPA